MAVDVFYTFAKLGETTQILATGPGRIRERLSNAIQLGGWAAVDPKALEVPGMDAEAPKYYRRIQEAITTAPPNEQRGVYGPSIESMSEDDACQIAQAIVSLESMVSGYLDDLRS